MPQAYEIEIQLDEKPWWRLPRRCEDRAEADKIAIDLVSLHIDRCGVVAIRYIKVK